MKNKRQTNIQHLQDSNKTNNVKIARLISIHFFYFFFREP